MSLNASDLLLTETRTTVHQEKQQSSLAPDPTPGGSSQSTSE